MFLPRISLPGKNLTFSQKISVASFIFLLLTVPLSLMAALMPTRFFKRAYLPATPPVTPPITITPTISPPLVCNPYDRGIISVRNYTCPRLGGIYPCIKITVTSYKRYQNTALRFTQFGADGYYSSSPLIFTPGFPNKWYQEDIRPANERYKIEFMINHAQQQNGEPCGEFYTYACPQRDKGNLDCDSDGLINETDLTIILKNWKTKLGL